MKPATVVLLSAALLLAAGWAGHDTASARETDWWVEEDLGPPSDAMPEPLDEFQAAVPIATGNLPPADASGTGDGEGTGSPSGQVVDPAD